MEPPVVGEQAGFVRFDLSPLFVGEAAVGQERFDEIELVVGVVVGVQYERGEKVGRAPEPLDAAIPPPWPRPAAAR
jgi:hypothetical protein